MIDIVSIDRLKRASFHPSHSATAPPPTRSDTQTATRAENTPANATSETGTELLLPITQQSLPHTESLR